MSPSDENRVFVGVRLDPAQLERVDALTDVQGFKVPRSEVIRRALDRGLEVLEAERAETSPRPKRTPRKG